MAEENDINIMREIDEALRADKMARLWNEHKSTIIGCCVAVVLGTAISVVWRNFSEANMEKITLKLVQAQDLYDGGKYKEAADAFGKIADDHSKQAPLAKLYQARALTSAGEPKEAALLLVKGGGDKGLGGLMKVKAATSGIINEEELREQAGKPFGASASELLALHYIGQGKNKEASELLAKVSEDEKAPLSLRQRARQMLGTIKG